MKKTSNFAVAIVTTGRFHVADLARELSAQGCDISFYCLSPSWKIRPFLGTKVRIISFFWWLAPLIVLSRGIPSLGGPAERIQSIAVDFLSSLFLRKCDVFIGMSGIALKSLHTAKKRFEAVTIIERGSRHILSQKEILDSVRGAVKVPTWAIEREIKGYTEANFISIPSEHVEQSFLERGFPKSRLVRNPYGVDLSAFHNKAPKSPCAANTAIIVGTWSYQKGCDLLTSAFRTLSGYSLLHIGMEGDAPLPMGEPWFIHSDPVSQAKLPEFYSRASVQVLPSRQDGLAMVLAQGLASGLVLVCSDKTGGKDLRQYTRNPGRIIEVSADVESIRKGLLLAFDLVASQKLDSDPGDLSALSWKEYGKRYRTFLDQTSN